MNRKIVLTGGGSGGHITPILAIAKEIKNTHPDTTVVYIGQTGDSLADIPAKNPSIDEVYTVRAGKFRRYHGEGFMQLLDLSTMFMNFRDFFYVIIGLFQSFRIIGKLKPDVIFSRGGFVSVPVCLGGALRRVPYITHDSDPIPSLANRIIARWASLHAVALPAEIYPYSQTKTISTGIPINDKFVSVNESLNNKYRTEIGVPKSAKILFIIGGGLGSVRVNTAVAESLPHLLQHFNDLSVVHVVGRANLTDMQHYYSKNLPAEAKSRVKVLGFIDDVYRYSGAADVVVTRAGATNLAEFAAQGKACIVVPSPFLAGGHQLKNAEYLEGQGAAVVINETDLTDDPNRLSKSVADLFGNKDNIVKLQDRLSKFAKPHATHDLAKIIVDLASHKE